MFVVKNEEMRKMDQFMTEKVGLSSLVLMENASRTVVDIVNQRFPLENYSKESLLILCGSGNNGADGLCITRWLAHQGYNVLAVCVGNMDTMSTECKTQYNLLKKLEAYQGVKRLTSLGEGNWENSLKSSDIIIDAIIGTGCSRTLNEVCLDLVEKVNKSESYVLAVDIPTGINGDNGKVMGDAIKSNLTVTFCMPKLGLILYPGVLYAGELIVSDIGIYEESKTELVNPISLLDFKVLKQKKEQGLFSREQNSHKGSFGKVGIIAGDRQMLGATILAAKAAYRSGAGLVRIYAIEEVSELLISAIPECVIVTYDKELSKERFDKELETFVLTSDVILIGPGLSKSLKARHIVQKVLQLDTKVVLDADALNIISEHLEWFEERVCEALITPHIGEMARLTGYPGPGISENALQFAEVFAEKYKVTIVLKSARTIIVTKNSKRYINLTGNAGLATAGSGDVLAGVISGLSASGIKGEEAALCGVLLHGYAGDVYSAKFNQQSLIASDIIDYLWVDID